MSISYPALLWALPLIVLAAIFYQKQLDSKELRRKTWLMAASVILILFALSKPYQEAGLVDIEIEGTEIVIAVDLSASMQGEDLLPNRLEYTKGLLEQLVEKAAHDRFAILGFTSSAIILSTMTDDRQLLLQLFRRLDNKNIVSKSTSLMPVLELADKLSQIENKQLILFSDGGEDTFDKEVQFAREHNMRVYTVTTATPGGVALKEDDGSLLLNKKEEIVVSAANPKLGQLAEQSGGRAFVYSDDMGDLIETIHDAVTTKEQSSSKERLHKQLFYYFLIPALLLFIIAASSLIRFVPLVLFVLWFPLPGQTAVTDFYHIQSAEHAYAAKDFETAAAHYEKLGDKNWQTLFNLGNAYYKSGSFGLARSVYNRIKTKDPKLKAMILYNIGNCYVRESTLEKARDAYKKSLALFYDKQTALNLIWTLDQVDSKRSPKTHQAKNMIEDDLNRRAHQSGEKKEKKSGGGKSDKKQGEAKAGKGGTKMQSKKRKQGEGTTPPVGLSPKQYQLINKGSSYETRPW